MTTLEAIVTKTELRYFTVGKFYWMVAPDGDHPIYVKIKRFNRRGARTVVAGATSHDYLADVEIVDSGEFERFAYISQLFETKSAAYRKIQKRYEDAAFWAGMCADEAQREEALNG